MRGLLAALAFTVIGASSAVAQAEVVGEICSAVDEVGATVETSCEGDAEASLFNANFEETAFQRGGRGRGGRDGGRWGRDDDGWGRDDDRWGRDDGRGRGDRYDGLPRGSYLRSCQDCVVRDDKLACYCADRNRNLVYSKLRNYRSCRGDIANNYGQLVCN